MLSENDASRHDRMVAPIAEQFGTQILKLVMRGTLRFGYGRDDPEGQLSQSTQRAVGTPLTGM
jgi:hypothetical protein